MRAKFIYEKFTDESDAIQDMGIGMPFVSRFEKDLSELKEVPNSDLKKLNFRDVSQKIVQLRYISGYLAMFYLEEKYGLKFEPAEHVEGGCQIGEARYKDYRFRLTWSTTMQSMKLNIDGGGMKYGFESGNCQSMKSLELNLLQAYNASNIELPIPPEKKKKT